MSWTFIKEKASTSYVVDQEYVNTNVLGFATETDGNLNEQNWGLLTLQDAQTAVPSQVADDIAMAVYRNRKEQNPHVATTLMFKIPQFTRWTPVPDTDVTFVSPGGKIFVIIDMQLHCPAVLEESCGVNFCIELDGASQMNSLSGTGDESNEFIDTGLSIANFQFNYGTSPAFKNDQKKLQVKGSYTVLPGVHTVRLLVRNLVAIAATPSQFLSQRETIVLHLWA